MKALLPLAATLAYLLSPANASWSKFLTLDSESYMGDHAEYRPTLKVNGNSPDFIDVRIPHVDDGFSYWLVVATENLPDDNLNFRSLVWEGVVPPKIQSIARLGEAVWATQPPKRRGFIEFTIHKDLLRRCYVYHDSDVSMDDGGYYYTYDLSKHKVEQAGAGQPATGQESKPEVKPKSGSKSEVRPH